MIKVEKNFEDVPAILKDKSREEAFDKNIAAASYCDDKNRYKVASVLNRLKEIYHLKCAYCEQKLLDAPKHIEHYRPKDIYYWLAYSWDNLLLCCGSCNSSKGKKFAVKNTPVKYNDEPFSQIHDLGTKYDEIEKPMIIDPEKDDILDFIAFDNNGKISSNDERVQHTIEKACNLNRDELVELRLEMITDFINAMNEHYFYYLKYKDISRFCPGVKAFIQSCRVENEFYAFRYFVCNNIEIFFQDNKPLQTIMKRLFNTLKKA